MSKTSARQSRAFPTAAQDTERARKTPQTKQTQSPAYELAFCDQSFLLREDLRPVRFQLELMKPELIMQERGIESTVILFGGARIPAPGATAKAATPEIAARLEEKSAWYTQAREFAKYASQAALKRYGREFVVVSGGGPGVMEAANLGACDVGAPSIGLNIVLPHEQAPNAYITPELCFQFHYFALRKMHFLIRAVAVAGFPGGFGTMDELFEVLTLIQTKKIEPIPILLFCREFWEKIINFEGLAEEGTIDPEDLNLFHFVENAEEGWRIISNHYGLDD